MIFFHPWVPSHPQPYKLCILAVEAFLLTINNSFISFWPISHSYPIRILCCYMGCRVRPEHLVWIDNPLLPSLQHLGFGCLERVDINRLGRSRWLYQWRCRDTEYNAVLLDTHPVLRDVLLSIPWSKWRDVTYRSRKMSRCWLYTYLLARKRSWHMLYPVSRLWITSSLRNVGWYTYIPPVRAFGTDSEWMDHGTSNPDQHIDFPHENSQVDKN